MKKLLVFASVVLAVCSCSSAPSKTDDVAKKIKDSVFRVYCTAKLDADKDGKISMEEAASVTSMDISELNISRLDGIEYFTGLKNFNCSSIKAQSIVLACPALEVLKCENNPALSKLDVSKSPALSFIFASHTGLKSLDLKAQQNLYRLWVDDTPLTVLDLSQCPKVNNLNLLNCPGLSEVTLAPQVDRDLLYLLKDDGLQLK
ncbi:MAG: hypothetical protein MJY84_07170 [Bacteroidales bacterium]|nr:hypothetical protein [Bacteroidales bacterium]